MEKNPMGYYSNLHYLNRWAALKRRGLGWPSCNKLYKHHGCIASCGLIDSHLELVVDLVGCNLNCKYCWGWKIRNLDHAISKTPIQAIKHLGCRAHHLLVDPWVAKSKYKLGVIRITGNEPSLQWDHLIQILRMLNDPEFLAELFSRWGFSQEAALYLSESKLIIETNGILMGKMHLDSLMELENLNIDLDISFKGVNPQQFEWLSSSPSQWFIHQISGFEILFDLVEESGMENIKVNPVLGINHSPGYCIWDGGIKYLMDVEIIDRAGNKLDFKDYSPDFQDGVLSRAELREDEAPFREYFGINPQTTREVIALVYEGNRYLNMLPSELVRSLRT